MRRSIAAAVSSLALLALPAGALARARVPVEVVPAPSAPFTVATTWGDEGYGPGQFGTGREKWGGDRQFDDPGGIAVGADGNILVADSSNNRVEVFTPDGRYLRSFGSFGWDPGASRLRARGRLLLPQGLAVDRSGDVYVADTRNDRVTRWSGAGAWRARIARRGSFPGFLIHPWGIAVSPRGLVYVADQANYRISMFTPAGRYVGSFGRFGYGPGQFAWIYGLTFDAAGNLYVTDQVKDEVMRFTARGQFLGAFGATGTRPGQFVKPMGVAVDPAGTVYVADRCNHRIQRFSSDGRFLDVLGAGTLEAPNFLTLDGAGNVYVSDYHRVVKFAPAGAPPVARIRAVRARAAATSPTAAAAHHNKLDVICRHLGGLGSAY